MAALALAAPAQAQADTTDPSLSSVTGNDTTITLIYDEALDTSSVPAGSDFTVKVDDAAVSLSSSPVAVSDSAVTLNLAAAVGIGKTVTVSYEVPASNPVQDLAGNDAAKFTDASVTVSGICDRTPAVRTAILGKIAGVTDCASVTSEHLSRIQGILTLSDQSLSSLQANDFSGLSSLQHLDFTDNSLSSLDTNIFDGLSSLQKLYLHFNSLSSLDANIFDGLSSLEILWLDHNSLSSLDANIFDGLSSLEILWLDVNSLSSLDADIFDGLSSLYNLNLANNSLSSLDADIFDGLSSFQYLDLGENSLSSLDADIFDGLSSFQHLFLSNNSLSSLDADIFDGLSSLQYLFLSANSLNSLDTDIFDGLSSLQYLSLSANSLNSLDTDIFDGLSSLQELYLDFNSLSSLPEGIFSSEKNLTSLEVLRLANNGLVCLPSDFPYDGVEYIGPPTWDRVEDGSIAVDVDLPDCFGVSLSVSPTVVREGSEGESITVTAALMAGEPRGNQKRAKTEDTTVTISVVPDTAEEGTDFEGVSSFSLTVAAGSASQTGTFTLTATADDEPEEPETVTVTGATALSDSQVAGTQVDGATIEIKDALGVSVSPTSLSVEEGETTAYTVVLITEPSGTVTVTPSSGDTGAATFSPSGLTFTSSNWNTAQTVTVSGEEDDDANDETVTISHSVSGYDSVTTADDVSVTVSDNDTPGVNVSPTSLSVDESGTTTYSVMLNTDPNGSVTVTPSSDDTGAATLSPASLTFTSSNWDTAQTITVSGEEDVNSDDETVTVSHSVSGYGAVTTADSVSVTVSDNDTPGVNVSPTSLSVDESGTTTYSVMLNTDPNGSVTVTPSSDDTGAATLLTT